MDDESTPPEAPPDEVRGKRCAKSSKLHVVQGKVEPGGESPPAGSKSTRFQPGNPSRPGPRKPKNPIDQVDRWINDAIRRVRAKKAENRMQPGVAMALAALLKLKLDVFEKHTVGEVIRELEAKLDAAELRAARLLRLHGGGA